VGVEKKCTEISSLIEIRPVGGEPFYVDSQRDMPKLIFAFCNFAKEPKNQSVFFRDTYRTYKYTVSAQCNEISAADIC
jgi:hypothetical protein